MAFTRHAVKSVGHFIFILPTQVISSQIYLVQDLYIKYGYILIPVKDLEELDGAAVDEEPIKQSDVLLEDPEEVEKHAKKLKKLEK